MKQIRDIFLLAALALFAASCVVDVEESKPVTVVDQDGRAVTLSLAVPGSPSSRGLTGADENAIKAIDVLLFKADNDRFHYRAIGYDITGGATPKFTVRLPEGTWNAVVLANARAALADSPHATLLSPAVTAGEGSAVTRATILAGLVQQLSDKTAKWPEGSFDGIPMWGYCNNFAINASTSTPAADVNLTRAIARVDVSVKDNATLRAKFSLASVRLYNYSRAGSLASVAAAITVNDGYAAAQWDGSKAIAPNLPALNLLADKASALKVKGPLAYEINNNPAVPVHAYKQEIYTFEAAAGAANTVTNTCLVIGGYYKATPGSTPVLAYYRVEFVAKDGETDYLPLLRNHNYGVEIQAVTGEGYPTPEGAYNSKPSNIVVEIVDWNDGGLNDVTFSQYYLSVDKSEFLFYAGGGTGSLSALTDFPSGWTIASLPGWLKIDSPSPAGGAAGEQATLALTANALKANDPAREGYFYIVAGNLKKVINVRQLDEEKFSLELAPGELTFYKTVAQAKTVTLFPTPASVNASAYTLGAAGEIAWKSGYDPALPANKATILNGTLLSIYPATNDGAATRSGSVMVILKGKDGNNATRVINVRQLARDPFFSATTSNPYPAAGGKYAFTVTSELPWKLAESADFLTLEAETNYHPATTGDYTYNFSLTSNESSFTARAATITVTSSDPDFAPRDFEIRQAAGGSAPYIDITDPSTKTYAFGTETAAKAVAYKTNAKWKYTTATGYADVIASANVAANTVQTNSATPSAPVTGSVSFTPSTSNAGVGGTTKSTVVTFSTAAGTSGIDEDTESVTLTRTIPAAFSVTAVSPANNSQIAATSSDVTLTASTNLQWWAQQGSASKAYSAAPTTYTTGGTVKVNVPARATNVVASWTSNSTVTIKAGYDAQNGLAANTPSSYTLTQLPYTLTVPNPSSTAANTVTVSVTTNAPNYSLELRLASATGTVITKTDGYVTGTSKSFTIGYNTGTSVRTIVIVNAVTGAQLASFSQTVTTSYAAVAPFIDITNPSNKTHSFGTTSTAKAVEYKTNAKWQFTTSTGYADVVKSANVAAGTTQTNTATPSVSVTGSVTFTPETNNTAGAGGTTKSTVITFKTAAGGTGVTEDSETVTLSRTIPALFSITGVSPANNSQIAATASDVSVTANRNLKWWVQQGSASKVYSSDAAYRAGDVVKITVPARSTSTAASWTGNATVTVKAGYDAQNGITTATPESYTFTQLPYTFQLETSDLTVNSITIKVTTNAGSVPIRLNVTNASGASVVGATTMTSGVAKSFDLGTVTAQRTIAIVNNVSGVIVGTFIQEAAGVPTGGIISIRTSCPDGYKIWGATKTDRYLYTLDGELRLNVTLVSQSTNGKVQLSSDGNGRIYAIGSTEAATGSVLCEKL